MELQFQRSACRCLRRVICDIQNQEQTQELKISDGMPDIGRIIGAWGQLILRGKEWRSDSVLLSGGIMGWVLYAPEDGSGLRTLDTWIPYQIKWSLPEGTREGQLRVESLLRFLDARSVSPRKIMLRAGISAMAEAMEPQTLEYGAAGEVPEDVAILKQTYPVRLCREAGEKRFLLDEMLTMPPSAPVPEKLIRYSLTPKITDKRIQGDKIVFRGNGDVHILYRSGEGQFHSWDFEVPFSQYESLEESYSQDGQPDISISVTNLDLELNPQGELRLKCGLVAQYLVEDRVMLELTEDAYSPRRPVTLEQEILRLPVTLDDRSENLYGETTLPGDADVVVDTWFLPEYPRIRRREEGFRLELPGQFQTLYYGADGNLQCGIARWEDSRELPAHEDCRVWASILSVSTPQSEIGDGTIRLKQEIKLQEKTFCNQELSGVSGLKLGELQEPDPSRPSVILRRPGHMGLWHIAKRCGSTVEAIRDANRLQGEPDPERMLLVPVL